MNDDHGQQSKQTEAPGWAAAFRTWWNRPADPFATISLGLTIAGLGLRTLFAHARADVDDLTARYERLVALANWDVPTSTRVAENDDSPAG